MSRHDGGIGGMSDTHFVTRTAFGLTHGNTLGLQRMWAVILHIDVWVASQSGQATGDQAGGSQAQSGQPGDGQAPAQDGQDSGGTADSSHPGQGQSGQPQPQPQGDPAAAQAGQPTNDSWRLTNDDGLYDKTLQRSDAVRMDDKLLTVRFTEVIPEGTYSLYHCLPSGTQLPVFLSVPFANLEEHGDDTPEPSNEDWTPPALQPAPAPVSDDPLLLYDPVDSTVAPAYYSDYGWYGSDALPDDSQSDSPPDSPDQSQNQPAPTGNSQSDSTADDSGAAPDPG
jgi:hypothetical protein